MKSINHIFAAAAAAGIFASGAAFADATFQLERPYVFQYLDGGKMPGSFFSSSSEITLAPGPHQVVIRFEGGYRESGDTRIVTSEPVVINLNVSENDKLFKIDFVYPRNYKKAQEYVKKPIIGIKDAQGQTVDAEIFVLPHRDGLQLGRDYLREIKDLGKEFKKADGSSNSVELVNVNSATADEQATIVVEKKAEEQVSAAAKSETAKEIGADADKLKQLKELYNSMDKDTKKAFRIWVVSE